MDLKIAILAVLGFLILGFLIAVSYGGLFGLVNLAKPTVENAVIADMLNICRSKFSVYTQTFSENSRKNFCCAKGDLNNNNIFEESEFCSRLCRNCYVQGMSPNIICEEPIDYYNNIDSC